MGNSSEHNSTRFSNLKQITFQKKIHNNKTYKQ